MMPLTSAVPKALFPLVDAANEIKSVLHVICHQAVSAGIEHIGIIAAPSQTDMVTCYFNALPETHSMDIEYIAQPAPRGFGDAVLHARDFIGDEPFMLFLGDHIHIADNDRPSCAAQVAQAFDSLKAVATIGMQTVSASDLDKVGVAAGVHVSGSVYRCTRFLEKPDVVTAKRELKTAGLPEDHFLAHCGIYIFSPEIFTSLLQVTQAAQNTGGEAELADAQTLLLQNYPEEYFLCRIAGRAYDTGNPGGYADAQAAFRSRKLP